MTLKKYEQFLLKVEEVWYTYPEWMKYWTRARLKEMLKEIE